MEASEQTDRARWDARQRELGAHPLQSWAWGALKERFGWRAHRLWLADGAATAQILVRPFRGLSAAYVPRGPQLSGQAELDDALVEAAVSLARRRRAAFLRFEPGVLETDLRAQGVSELFARHRFREVETTLQPRSSVRVDLRRSEEELFGLFSKGHRADIRRAEREGVVVRRGNSKSDVELLHEMLRASQQRKTFAVHSLPYYRTLCAEFGDEACLLLAEHANRVVAGSLVIAFGGQAVYLAAGSNQTGRAHHASHLLQWHALRWARSRATSYDLWGIPDARGRLALLDQAGGADRQTPRSALEEQARADPLDGVYRFKKGWGGEVVRTLPAFDRVLLAPAYWFWRWRRSSD